MRKRLLSLLISLAMILTMIPMTGTVAYADSEGVSDSQEETEATIDSVKISGGSSIYTGSKVTYVATVTGSAEDQTVIWSISGNVSDGTTISSAGTLTVASDETAASITVTATSHYDAAKSDSKVLTIKQTVLVNAIYLTWDLDTIGVNTGSKVSEINERLRANASSATEGTSVYTNSNTEIDKLNSRGEYVTLTDSDTINTSDEYVFGIGTKIASGYTVPDDVKSLTDWTSPKSIAAINDFDIYVNGVKREDVYVFYSESWSSVHVYVPIGKASGEGKTVLKELNFAWDLDTINVNTNCTVSEINKRLRENASSTTAEVPIDKSSNGNIKLVKKESSGGWITLSDSDTLNATDNYGFFICATINDGYTVPDDVISVLWNSPKSVSEIEDFDIFVNGVKSEDAELFYSTSTGTTYVCAYIPIGKASETDVTPVIETFEISNEQTLLNPGETEDITYTLKGTGIAKTKVSYAVSGNTSAGTIVSETGILTVGEDETSETITVTASLSNASETASKTFTITTLEKTIDSVTISSGADSADIGSREQYAATLTGSQDDKEVIWSISGNEAEDTVIAGDGTLTVSPNETAASVTVTATSHYDTSKSASKAVAINQLDLIKELDLTWDPDVIDINTESTVRDINARLSENIQTDTPGVSLDAGKTALYYVGSNDLFYRMSADSEVALNKQYALYVIFGVEDTARVSAIIKDILYYNPVRTGDISGFDVKVNGQIVDDAWVFYSSEQSSICLYIKVGSARSCTHSNTVNTYSNITRATISANGSYDVETRCADCNAFISAEQGVVIPAVTTRTFLSNKTIYAYTGKNIYPIPVLKDCNGKILVRGTDYVVTYPTACKNIGTYTVRITFKNWYAGYAVLTYYVVPQTPSLKSLTSGKRKLTVKATTKPSAKYGSYYQIAYKMKGSSTWKFTTTSSTSKTIKGLTKGKYYYVLIRAFKKVNGKNYYGAWSAAKLSKKIK